MARDLFDVHDLSEIGQMKGKYSQSWVEESFVFEQGKGHQVAASETRDFLGRGIGERSLKILAFTVLVGLFIILARVFYLQIIQGDHYRQLAEQNRVRLRSIPAERGIIFDHEGKPLVENVPSFLLSIVPQDLPADVVKRKEVIKQIADVSGVPQESIEALIEKYKNYSFESLTIKENLDYDTALDLYIKNANLPGIIIEKSMKRNYLIGSTQEDPNSVFSLSHILGYLGKLNDDEIKELKPKGYLVNDNVGKTGLEKNYESELRGTYGVRRVEMDVGGHEQRVLTEDPPVPGKNLYLTLDLDAQKELETLMKNTLKRLGKKRGAAIAMNPKTGGIIAMVSWPSFDINKFANGISQADYKKYSEDADRPLFNRVIGGSYPSGSTVKLIVSAAALQEKVITPLTTFLSTGGLKVDRWYFKDWKVGGHGITDVRKALAWSINTFFYYVGGGYGDFNGLGLDRLLRYMRKFNLAQKTGIDLPGENAGFLPSREWKEKVKGERWYIGDTYNLSIGQGDLLVTPLQVSVWTAAIANGGKIIRPHLAERTVDPITNKEEKIETKVLNQDFVSPQNIQVVKEGTRQCVTSGSCQLLKTLPFTSAGKTGTAQWSSKYGDHAWFTSFAPYENPQIVVTVLVEEGVEGSTAAMPIARDFLSWWGKKYLVQ